MKKKPAVTSPRIATLAGKVLSDPRASQPSKTLAGSALAQASKHTAHRRGTRKLNAA